MLENVIKIQYSLWKQSILETNMACSYFTASDLDSIRALFNEKEKELSLAVAKVEELTRQLEELRRGRTTRDQPPASALELDKLRRELMVRENFNVRDR